MGPYCRFCDRRCFIHLPLNTAKKILEAYRGRAEIIATCPEGQKYEKGRIGYCYADIQTENQEAKSENNNK